MNKNDLFCIVYLNTGVTNVHEVKRCLLFRLENMHVRETHPFSRRVLPLSTSVDNTYVALKVDPVECLVCQVSGVLLYQFINLLELV